MSRSFSQTNWYLSMVIPSERVFMMDYVSVLYPSLSDQLFLLRNSMKPSWKILFSNFI